MADSRKHQVLIVDDHPLVCDGLSTLLDTEGDIHVCGIADDGPAAMEILRQRQVDLVIVDLMLKGMSGIDLIKEIRSRYSHMPILVLSMHQEEFYAERSLRAGAMGYVTKDSPYPELIGAIRKVLNMGVYLSQDVASRLIMKVTHSSGDGGAFTEDLLTDRELEVLECLGRGLNIPQIARRWSRSARTVESHCANIKRKLKLQSSRDLLQRAIQWVQAAGRQSTPSA